MILKITLLNFLTITFLFGQNFDQFDLGEIDKDLEENANIIFLEDELKIDLLSIDKMKLSKHQKVIVLNEEGHRNFSLYAYFSPYRKIKKIAAVIYGEDGEIKENLKKKDFQESTGSTNKLTVADDWRLLSYKHSPSSFPYVVDFYLEEETSTTIISDFYFQNRFNQSVKHSKLEINDFANLGLESKINNFEKYNVKVIEDSPVKKVYEVNNLKAVKQEYWISSYESLFPNVKFRTNNFTLVDTKAENINSWDALGRWYYENLLNGYQELDVKTIEEIEMLLVDAKTDLDKAKIIYQFVQDKVRYISIQLGIGGWKPIKASEVDRLSYGDCKALTNYTKALLDSQGIESNYCVVNAGNFRQNIPADFPTITGNHAFLHLPKENIWLECTSQTVPFGHIVGFTDDRDVLVVSEKGGRIKHTRIYLPEDNMFESVVKVILTKDNVLNGEIKNIVSGINFPFYKGLKNASDQNQYIKHGYRHLKKLKTFNFLIDDSKETQETGKFDFSFSINDYAKKAGVDKFLFELNFFNKKFKQVCVENRKFPVEVQRGNIEKSTCVLQLSHNMKIKKLFAPIDYITDFGEYKLTLKKKEQSGEYIIKRFFKLKKQKIEATEYIKFCTFLNNIAKYDNKTILITNNEF